MSDKQKTARIRVAFESTKQCACEYAAAEVGMFHVQRCEDVAPHLGCWPPNRIGGDQCSIQVYAPDQLVTCLSCGTPWALTVKVSEDEL